MSNRVHPTSESKEPHATKRTNEKPMCAYLRSVKNEAREELNDEHIRKMIALGLPPELISKITGVSVEELKERYNFTDTEPAPSSGS